MRQPNASPRAIASSSLREGAKKPGLHYIRSPEGFELPVIDLTHPAFSLDPSAEELSAALSAALSDHRARAKLPKLAQKLVFGFFLRDSLLAGKIASADGGYLDGLGTYLLKLGPDNLGTVSSMEIDRKIASSLPCLSTRLRLRATAYLLAESIEEAMTRGERKGMRLFNIGGGPAMDSLNALLLLAKDRRRLLEGRKIEIRVLDLDETGPAFGAEALSVHSSEGAALEGLEVEFHRLAFDWTRPSSGAAFDGAEPGDYLIASSEGGLFEYGSDEDILLSLRAFHEASPSDAAFVGSLTKGEGGEGEINGEGKAAVRLWRGKDFAELVGRAGWRIAREKDCALCQVVALRKIENFSR